MRWWSRGGERRFVQWCCWHAATDESLDVEAVTEVDWIDQLGTRAAVAPRPALNLAISAQNAGACRFGSYRFGEGVALEIDR